MNSDFKDLLQSLHTYNARQLLKAFLEFGVPLIGVTQEDFATPKTQFSIGVPPCEIDFLTSIPGLDFAPSWEQKTISSEFDFPIYYLGKSDIIKAKQTAGRPQDLADLDELSRI